MKENRKVRWSECGKESQIEREGQKKTRHNQKLCKRKEAEFTQKTQRNKVSSEKAKKRDRDGGAKIRTSRGRDWIVGWKISCRERERGNYLLDIYREVMETERERKL